MENLTLLRYITEIANRKRYSHHAHVLQRFDCPHPHSPPAVQTLQLAYLSLGQAVSYRILPIGVYIKLVFAMFKKSLTSRMSACKLKPIALDFVSVQPRGQEDLFETLRTPRHQAYRAADHEATNAQKQGTFQKSATNRDRQASLKKLELILRENLLDLDLDFQLESPRVCDVEKLTESHKFVIRKKRTPSLSSKGKDTSAGSSDNSLEGIQDSEEKGKKVTDSPLSKRTLGRGKSHTKNVMPCRIVNTKKLPFELHTRSLPKKRVNLDQIDLNISIIERKEEVESLVSLDSIQQICNLL